MYVIFMLLTCRFSVPSERFLRVCEIAAANSLPSPSLLPSSVITLAVASAIFWKLAPSCSGVSVSEESLPEPQ